MELTNREINDAFQAVMGLFRKPLPWALSFQVSKLKRAIQKAGEPIEETQQKLIMECAEKDKDGNVVRKDDGSFKIAKEHLNKLEADSKALMAATSKVDFEEKIVIPTDKGREIEPYIIDGLLPFIDTETKK